MRSLVPTAALFLSVACQGESRRQNEPPVQQPVVANASVQNVTVPADSGRIPDSMLAANGVRLGAKTSVVLARFGPPESRDTSDERETLGYRFITWHYPDVTVEFADSAVAISLA